MQSGEVVSQVGAPDEKVYGEAARNNRKSYQTPIVTNIDGKDQLITTRALLAVSYDPQAQKIGIFFMAKIHR